MIYDLDKLEIKILDRKKFYDGVTFEYNNELFYYKKVKNIRNYYNELIAEKLAKKLGVACCEYYHAYYDDEIGIVSKMFDKTKFVSMEDYLKSKYQNDNISDRNNLEDIWNAFLLDFDEKTVEKLMTQLVNIFMFDSLIGNADRHTENYGLIITDKTVDFAPLYDNENMLSDEAIYEGEYCLGIEYSDYENENQENLLYKFLNISADFYKEELKEKIKYISEESLEEIIKELEKDEIIIPSAIKSDILKRFSCNRNMINNYFNGKKRKYWFYNLFFFFTLFFHK